MPTTSTLEARYGLQMLIDLEYFENDAYITGYVAAIFLANLFDLMGTRAWV